VIGETVAGVLRNPYSIAQTPLLQNEGPVADHVSLLRPSVADHLHHMLRNGIQRKEREETRKGWKGRLQLKDQDLGPLAANPDFGG
jgi:hypothetical protein